MFGAITRSFEQDCLDEWSHDEMRAETKKPFEVWTSTFFRLIEPIMTPRTVGWYAAFHSAALDAFHSIEYRESIGETVQDDAKQTCEKILSIYDSYVKARHPSMWGPKRTKRQLVLAD